MTLRRPTAALALLCLLATPALAGYILGNPNDGLQPCRGTIFDNPTDGIQPWRITIFGNPTDGLRPCRGGLLDGPRGGLRPGQRPEPRPRLAAPVAGLVAVRLDGARVEMAVDGLDLADPLPLPDGPVAELELELDGPVLLVAADGRVLAALDQPSLTLPIQDPDTPSARVAVELPEAGATVAELLDGAVLIED